MGRSAVRLVLALAVVAVPHRARAEPSVVVARGDDAGGCPDDAELRRLAAAARVPAASVPTHVYRVVFARAGVGYRTEIVDETAQRSRRLEDKGPGCAAIGQAAAVVLATMWGSEQDVPSAPELPKAQAAASPGAASQDRAAAPLRRSPAPTRWTFGAGPGLAVGIVRPAAPSLLAELGVEGAMVSLGVSALWIPEQDLALGPGSLAVQLLAAGARGCAFTGRSARVGACGRLLGGVLQGSSEGFDANGGKTRPWLAGGLEVFVEGPMGPRWLRYRSAAGALVPLHAESFSVAGVGSAYSTPSVGGLFTVAVEVVAP